MLLRKFLGQCFRDGWTHHRATTLALLTQLSIVKSVSLRWLFEAVRKYDRMLRGIEATW